MQGARGEGKRLRQQNLICNFRAQNLEDYEDWKWFCAWCKKNGITICRPVMANIRAFRKFVEGINIPETINAFPMIVQLKQQNTFVYSPLKPRREPRPNSYFRNSFATFGSRVSAEAYVLQKASELWKEGQKSFCFKDFPTIKHESFKQIIFRLRKAEKLVPIEPRTNPRFYSLMDPPSPDEFENF